MHDSHPNREYVERQKKDADRIARRGTGCKVDSDPDSSEKDGLKFWMFLSEGSECVGVVSEVRDAICRTVVWYRSIKTEIREGGRFVE